MSKIREQAILRVRSNSRRRHGSSPVLLEKTRSKENIEYSMGKHGGIRMDRIRNYNRSVITNAIPIKLANGTWKVQMDYSSLNKACSKDMYPFSEEGEELASLIGYPYKCFLRLPMEYSHIRMAEDDEEKTGFQTEEGVYCFTHMPKELKKSTATLHRMMEKDKKEIRQVANIGYPQRRRDYDVMSTTKNGDNKFCTTNRGKESRFLFPMCASLYKEWRYATPQQKKGKEDEGLVMKKFFGQGEHVEGKPDANEGGTFILSEKLQAKSTPTPRAWWLYVGKETIEEGLAASTNQGMKDLHVFIDSLTLVAQEVSVGIKTRPSVEETSSSNKGKAASNAPRAEPNYNAGGGDTMIPPSEQGTPMNNNVVERTCNNKGGRKHKQLVEGNTKNSARRTNLVKKGIVSVFEQQGWRAEADAYTLGKEQRKVGATSACKFIQTFTRGFDLFCLSSLRLGLWRMEGGGGKTHPLNGRRRVLEDGLGDRSHQMSGCS
ncbi:hypothetical protein Tco_0928233 [Tanacetum coccineum]